MTPLVAYHQGGAASDAGMPQEANPHPDGSDEQAAWDIGWAEAEGPAYTLSPLSRRARARPTLGDIWPADIRRLTTR